MTRGQYRAIFLLLLSGGLAAWLFSGGRAPHAPPAVPVGDAEPAPRFESFVGKQTCAECHAEEAKRHSGSGHAHTFHRTEDFPPAKILVGQTFKDPVRDVSFRYDDSPPEGLRVHIPGRFDDMAFPLKYVMGSNTHAATFLTLLPMQDGQTGAVEHRVSLYGETTGLTPGQRNAVPREDVEQFGVSQDPLTARACVGCHTTHFEIFEHDLRNVIANVECESCHGAGREHVESMKRGGTDYLIRSLAATDRKSSIEQIRSCARCHRFPEDIAADKLKPDNWKLVRYQSVGMLQSPCFTRSEGAFACSTCHEPHESSRSHDAASQKACLKCHAPEETASATCPVTKTGNCLDCHMPKVEIHKGIFFRDHWIRVHETKPMADGAPRDSDHSGPKR